MTDAAAVEKDLLAAVFRSCEIRKIRCDGPSISQTLVVFRSIRNQRAHELCQCIGDSLLAHLAVAEGFLEQSRILRTSSDDLYEIRNRLPHFMRILHRHEHLPLERWRPLIPEE